MKETQFDYKSNMIRLIMSLFSIAVAQERDFYKILGIPRSANEKEIKKAFKRMSLKYHPDKNKGDDNAIKRFQDISSAYDTLSDGDKRRKYDRCGEKCVNEPDAPSHDPFDFFGDFFGGGGRREPRE